MTLREKYLVLLYMYPENKNFGIHNNELVWNDKEIKKPSDDKILKVFESDEYKNMITSAASIDVNNSQVQNELLEIDISSIRSLREWVSKQTDAPKFIKDYEKQAKEKRKKLK